MKAIITVGISCSGKTTFANSLDRSWININRDDLRFAMTGAKDWSEYKFNKSFENSVTEVQIAMAEEARAVGKSVIISDTNLNKKTRDMWESLLKGMGYAVQIRDFSVDLKVAYKRDAARARGVGEGVIYQQYLRYLEYKGALKYIQDTSKRPAVVFDVDGTLAEMGDRSPFEWHKVGIDKPRELVVEMLRGYKELGLSIVLLSGRDGCCADQTADWLEDNDIPFDELLMRGEGDNRPDTVVKKVMFFSEVAPNYQVVAVVDDRPCMIRTWYEIGIPTVISVANPWIEF